MAKQLSFLAFTEMFVQFFVMVFLFAVFFEMSQEFYHTLVKPIVTNMVTDKKREVMSTQDFLARLTLFGLTFMVFLLMFAIIGMMSGGSSQNVLQKLTGVAPFEEAAAATAGGYL